MPYTYEYPHPAVTVDCAVYFKKNETWNILLIQRGNPPFQDKWALPGGFVDMDETLENAARRELEEETGLGNIYLEQFYTFGDPGRDPRGRTVSVIFFGFTDKKNSSIKGADDAKDARWFTLDNLPGMAFDHNKIVSKLITKLKNESKIDI